MKVHVSLDDRSYAEKPKGKEIIGVKRRCCGNWQEIEVRELADLVGNSGHAMVPGHMVGGMKSENCTEMQLFALDFDDGVTFREIRERCDAYGLKISFTYHTFSSSDQCEKFRVVFVHEYLIDDLFVVRMIIGMFHKIFPECDSACKNPDRLFLGGKELIYIDEDAHYALVQLLPVFYESLKNQGNLPRDLKTFCRKNHLFYLKNRLAVGPAEYLETLVQIDGIMDLTIIHIIGQSTNPSFFILESKKTEKSLHSSITCAHPHRRLDIHNSTGCQLLDDFNSGKPLEHMEKFAILLNLSHINGGVKHFLNVIEEYYDEETVQKWKRDIEYTKGYLPMRCSETFCPYHKECVHQGTIIDTLALNRKITRQEVNYVSCGEAWAYMYENIETAYTSVGAGIHLIKAQTALGKTSAYIKLIMEHPETKFLIAVPTNALKKQVVEDLIEEGLRTERLYREDLFVTPSISASDSFIPDEIREEISDYHKRGFHTKKKECIAKYYEEIKDDLNRQAVIKDCKKHLDGMDAMADERVVVTTHAYLMQMPESFLRSYCVIIDEDILYLQIFNKIESVSLSTLQVLAEKNIYGLSWIAERMVKAPLNCYEESEPCMQAAPLTCEQMESWDIWPGEDDNVNDLLYAGAFVKLKDRDTGETVVKYFCPQTFPEAKYIIVSATINENLYRRYFNGSMNVVLYPERKAAYTGRVIQYTYHSLGRRDLREKQKVFDLAREISENPKLPIITFLKYEREAGEYARGLHFGNLTGINDLQGQDIGIIGTPYKTEEAYKLIACYLGADVNQQEDQSPRYRRVEYKGCNFVITTYQDELLREINLYSLESELEQAVGRARALREPCTVYVFSAFPCEQAELRTGEYLNNPAEDELPAERSVESGAAKGKVKKERLSAWQVQLPCGCY